MLPQLREGVGTPLLRAGGEDGAGRAPVGVRAGGAGAGLQVVPRLILPARTGADQPFGADLVLCSEWRTPPFTYHFHSNSSWMCTLVKLR